MQHDVAALESIPPGEVTTVEVDGREIGLARVGEAVHAFGLRCTHAAWRMNDAPLEGWDVVCTLHGARFDVRDGCPNGGPATKPLDTWPVRVEDGRVLIGLPPRRTKSR